MSRWQPIYDIATLCAAKGLRQAVLCPGSRCAPLTIAFSRHPDINTKTFSDERSAGFVALGMAQHYQVPSILVCTSGTAAYNFSPAVAEAYFNEVPLLIFTADRPSEWIGQQDGQTIYQQDIFGKHVKKSFTLPADYDHADSGWAINRIVNEAINLSLQHPKGPVHINAPFREPLYPSPNEKVEFSTAVRVIHAMEKGHALSNDQKLFIQEELKKFHRILIVAGQGHYDHNLILSLRSFLKQHRIPLVADIITNLHSLEEVITHADLFLGQSTPDVKSTLTPDLLITFGKSTISKNVKLFLRNNKPATHWHIEEATKLADTYQSITHFIEASPASFFGFAGSLAPTASFENQKQQNYLKLWEIEERRCTRVLDSFFPQTEFGELELVHHILKHIPENTTLHLANSMSVRYANFMGLLRTQKNVNVYCNRGTSGIDGCTSTVVGHCLSNTGMHLLITGDLAFFYDRNAFWHNYALPNLRVVVLNNHGGIIFGMIDGPESLPESAEYFVTQQRLNARKLCEEFNFDYLYLDNKRKLKHFLIDFFESDGRTKVLELESDTIHNKSIFNNLKQQIKNSYES